MPFKVGDTVRSTDGTVGVEVGETGVVIFVDEGPWPYRVAFMPKSRFSPDISRWFSEKGLEPAEPPKTYAFKFGDKVNWEGGEYVIIGVDHEDFDGLPYLLVADQTENDIEEYEGASEWAAEEDLSAV